MTRLRQIKKYGDSWIIKLNPIDAKDFGIQEGDEVDMEDVLIKLQCSTMEGEKK